MIFKTYKIFCWGLRCLSSSWAWISRSERFTSVFWSPLKSAYGLKHCVIVIVNKSYSVVVGKSMVWTPNPLSFTTSGMDCKRCRTEVWPFSTFGLRMKGQDLLTLLRGMPSGCLANRSPRSFFSLHRSVFIAEWDTEKGVWCVQKSLYKSWIKAPTKRQHKL